MIRQSELQVIAHEMKAAQDLCRQIEPLSVADERIRQCRRLRGSTLGSRSPSLIVGALRPSAGTYIGDYQLTISPYFFMSEKGTLSMIVSGESLRKLTQGIPVSVTGQATTKKSGKTKAVNAKLTIFKTSYQFGNN